MNLPVRILLVDDSPYFLDVARDFLGMQEEFEVSGFAVEGRNALDQARQLKPDVILLDLNLGTQSGMRLIPLFKKHLPFTKIIVLTIMDGEGYQLTAMKAGADAFVLKTRMTEELAVKILEVLGQNQAPRNENAACSFSQLMECSSDLLYRYEFRPYRGFTYVSPAAAVLTGYTAEEHYADPDLGFKLVHPEDRHILESAAQEKNPASKPLVLRWVRKDGSILWTEQRNVSIFDETGELIALEGIARDITERKQAEEAIRWQNAYLAALQKTTLELLSERRLELLLENIVQRAGQLVNTNSGFLDMVDPQSGRMIPKIGLGALTESLGHEIKIGEGLTGTVWQTGQPILVKDYNAWEKRISNFPTGLISSIVGVPLAINGRVLGVLGMGHEFTARQTFHDTDIELLMQFAHLAALAIENAHLFSTLQQEVDERKHAEERIKQQMQDLQRWYEATLDRETGVMQLKREVNELLRRLDEPNRYPSAE